MDQQRIRKIFSLKSIKNFVFLNTFKSVKTELFESFNHLNSLQTEGRRKLTKFTRLFTHSDGIHFLEHASKQPDNNIEAIVNDKADEFVNGQAQPNADVSAHCSNELFV